jgi:hypothetical protein
MMKDADLTTRLVEGVLTPLMRGGELCLVPPIGPGRAEQCVLMGCPGKLEANVVSHKLRAARSLYPLDEVGAISADEWLMLCALNDALQLTNPSLTTPPRSTENAGALEEICHETVRRIHPCRTVFDVLSRHALFSRLAELGREDHVVSWWSGSRHFVGKRPPSRLLAWPRLRRVELRSTRVSLEALGAIEFDSVLAAWLEMTPLTALGAAAHLADLTLPRSLTQLLQTEVGRKLALRVVLGCRDPRQTLDKVRASSVLDGTAEGSDRGARRFLEEGALRVAQLT